MEIKRRGMVVVLVAMGLWQSACSFVFAKGPPANPAQLEEADCRDGGGWAIADAIMAGLSGSSAAMAPPEGETEEEKEQRMAGAFLGLVVWGVSALYGLSQIEECHAAKRRLAAGVRVER